MAKILKEGMSAPDFKCKNENEEMLSLKDFKGKKLVLYFYPKDDTPGCTQEACDFQDNLSRLKKSGTVILGVSKDSPAKHLKFKEKYSLKFSLLSDEDGKLCEKYGVWKEKSMYGRKYMGIERSTFVINGEGKIVKIFSKVKVKGHVAEVAEVLKAI